MRSSVRARPGSTLSTGRLDAVTRGCAAAIGLMAGLAMAPSLVRADDVDDFLAAQIKWLHIPGVSLAMDRDGLWVVAEGQEKVALWFLDQVLGDIDAKVLDAAGHVGRALDRSVAKADHGSRPGEVDDQSVRMGGLRPIVPQPAPPQSPVSHA